MGKNMASRRAKERRRQSECARKAEQDRRDQHQHDEARLRPGVISDDHRVLTFLQWCELNGFSQSTGNRIRKSGTGPIFTQLSPHRIGVTVANNRAWIESRARG
jgi:hypothetical protein